MALKNKNYLVNVRVELDNKYVNLFYIKNFFNIGLEDDKLFIYDLDYKIIEDDKTTINVYSDYKIELCDKQDATQWKFKIEANNEILYAYQYKLTQKEKGTSYQYYNIEKKAGDNNG